MKDLLKNKWFVYFAGLAAFFLLIHYYGFFSDASLYLLQVIHFLDLSRFENDVPFMFGNQDAYSIFSPIVAVFFKVFGVNTGGMVATLIAQLFWCFASMLFFKNWSEKYIEKRCFLQIYLIFLIVFTAKLCYCGYIGFYFIEPILVARFISVAFVFLGLAFFLSKKYVSLCFFIAASLFHPLMGGWGAALWLFYYFPRVRIPVVLFSLLFPLTGFLHIGKLDFYPADWLSRPLEYTPSWGDSVNFVVLALFWGAMWGKIENKSVSRFALNMFIVVVVALYLQYAGVWTEHILLYQVQPFRVWWLALMPTIPVFFVYIKQLYDGGFFLEFSDASVLFIALAAFTNCQNPVVLLIPLLLLVALWRNKKRIYFNKFWEYILYGTGFWVITLEMGLNNLIQLSLGHGLFDSQWILRWLDVPGYMGTARMILLLVMAAAALANRKYWQSLAFCLAFCNSHFTMLPLFAILYCFPLNFKGLFNRFLIALVITLSVAELLGTADANIRIGLWFLLISFFFACAILSLLDLKLTKWLVRFAVLLIVSVVAWDVSVWDNRTIERKEDEKQMDAFLDKPVFPQVRDRGRMLMVENREFPLLSRFKFLTGAYGDELIHTGEVFYKGQFHEALRRKKALFYGDTATLGLSRYRETINMVYSNPDTLLSRAKYLCDIGDISYLATDYSEIPLFKEDSVFLEVKKKYIFLYGCHAASTM